MVPVGRAGQKAELTAKRDELTLAPADLEVQMGLVRRMIDARSGANPAA